MTDFKTLDALHETAFPALDHWTRLERFLICGSEDGHYYATARPFTIENASSVRACLTADGLRVVGAVVQISASGRAPKNDPALFVLALATSPQFADARTNAAALSALPNVARTGSHLCSFAGFVERVRGWGRGLRSAIADWYSSKPVSELAYQMLMHPRRNGWSHRDLLRLSHPRPETAQHNALFQWATEGALGHLATSEIASSELRQIHAFELAKRAGSQGEIVRLIEDYRLTAELISPEWRNSRRVWEALLEFMPHAAMLRNLGKLTEVGLLAPRSASTALVVARLIDRRRVVNSKLHPIALLSALLAYQEGTGPGGVSWTPVANVVDALDEAFYLAFDNVEPTGKRVYLALDAGGSLQNSACSGIPDLNAAMGAAVLAMAVARTESKHVIGVFQDEMERLDITRKDRLDRVCEAIGRPQHSSDASLPMRDALQRGLKVDAFVIITGSETWTEERHPVPALNLYRRETDLATKLVVIAMAPDECTITDPHDVLQMNVAGFNAHVPGVVADFIRDGAGQ